MKGNAKPLKILILARRTPKERLEALLEQVKKISYDRLELYFFSAAVVTPRLGFSVTHLDVTTDLKVYFFEWNMRPDLLIVDDLERSELSVVISLMLRQVPVMAENLVTERFKEILIPDKTVVRYWGHSTPQLPMLILSFLRNTKLRHQIVQGALNQTIGFKDIWKRESAFETLVEETAPAAAPPPPPKPVPVQKAELPPLPQFESVLTLPSRASYEKIVDLVIISYNTLRFLRECIETIITNTDYPYRLIVVDNGSTDGSITYLKSLPNLTLIENRENLGYARACNQGIAVGVGEYIVILNSDIKVTKGWLEALVETAKSDRRIGVLGPKMVNERGLIVGAGVTKLDTVCPPRGWLVPDGPGVFDRVEDCVSVGGACYMLKREVLNKVGAFDESYFFYYEETDLSLRILEKGYRVVYCPHARVIHHHEGSLDRTNPVDRRKRNRYFEESQRRFLAKWGDVLEGSARRKDSKDIIAFGIIPWTFRHQRPQQLLSRLAEKGYRVLYISNTCQKGGKLEQLGERIFSFNPDGEGLAYLRLKDYHGTMRIVASIYRALGNLNILNPIIWCDAPYWERILEHFDRQYLIYNCMDFYADFSDLKQNFPDLQTFERRLGESADLIFASSKPLQQAMKEHKSKCFLLPNGVDRQHFNLNRVLETPQDLQKIPGPIIGYYGAIADWLDLELIKDAAAKLSNFSFVLIGGHSVNIDALRSKPNVYFLGEKPYSDLPKYVQHFLVAMIPFKNNALTRATNPVKLYEYLATGKPVVSVDLPEVRQFADVVYIAKDYNEFIYFLREVGYREEDWVKKKRVQSVEAEDWNDRVKEIQRHMQNLEKVLTAQSLLPKMIYR